MDEEQILRELEYKAVRSSGPGGQHANKTATKVELSFDVENSRGLSDDERERILKKLSNRISKESLLKMSSEDSRSQHANKDMVTTNFLNELKNALKKPRRRKKTKPTHASKMKRLKKKKRNSEIKKSRRDPLQ